MVPILENTELVTIEMHRSQRIGMQHVWILSAENTRGSRLNHLEFCSRKKWILSICSDSEILVLTEVTSS